MLFLFSFISDLSFRVFISIKKIHLDKKSNLNKIYKKKLLHEQELVYYKLECTSNEDSINKRKNT
jgi:hypothetical protein